MTNAGSQELQHILDLVKSRTGYPVSVSPEPLIKTHSEMLSAASGRTFHMIRVNPKYDRFSNSLVAQQAAMLLIKWADPNRIADFRIVPQKTESLKMQLLSQMKKQGYEIAVARNYIDMIVQGLLQQLNSIPCQIMATEMCYELCPSLKEEIELSTNFELKENSAVLDPRIKSNTPAEIYGRSVAMNAAQAKRWSDKSGDRLAIFPYEATGHIKKATELCNALDQIPENATDRYQQAVDSWAKILDLEGWYDFTYRKA